MEKITVEVSGEFRETMDFLKQVLAGKTGEPVKDDSELFEIMIAGFMSLIEQEMSEHHNHSHGDSCGCGHSHD